MPDKILLAPVSGPVLLGIIEGFKNSGVELIVSREQWAYIKEHMTRQEDGSWKINSFDKSSEGV